MEQIAAAYVLGPEQERSHPGTWPTIKAGAADTGGAMTAVAGELGGWQSGPPLHVHDQADECMYVLAGRLLVQIDRDIHTLEAGSFAWLPRETPHTFANAGPDSVRMFGVTMPGGIEEFFAAHSAYFAALVGPPDPAEQARIAAGWGKVMGPPIRGIGAGTIAEGGGSAMNPARTLSPEIGPTVVGRPIARRTPMLSKTHLAGAGALLAAPIVVIVANLMRPNLSDDAAKQVAALTDHRAAMIASISLSAVAIVLLTAGIVWLAFRLAPHNRNLAIAGGVLGTLGSAIVLFVTGVGAAAPAIVHGLNPAQATTTLHHIQTSVALSALEPLQVIGDIGIALLGIAAVKAGAPRWAAAAIVVGALGEGAGFGSGTKPLVIVAFAVMFVGLLEAVRRLVVAPVERIPSEAVAVS